MKPKQGATPALNEDWTAMTKTYTQLVKQIETLQAEAEQLRRKEMDGVIDRIREAITFYGLTAADLGLSGGAPRARKTSGAVAGGGRRKVHTAVKFRDDQGNTWGGRGPRPRWLRDALASGRSLKDFEAG